MLLGILLGRAIYKMWAVRRKVVSHSGLTCTSVSLLCVFLRRLFPTATDEGRTLSPDKKRCIRTYSADQTTRDRHSVMP